MTTFQFHTTVGPDGMIAVPSELCGREVDVRIVPAARRDDEKSDENKRRHQHLLKAIESAPVWTDEEYNEWLETRKWINESVAAREKMWDDLD